MILKKWLLVVFAVLFIASLSSGQAEFSRSSGVVVSYAICGDGTVEAPEQCDDGMDCGDEDKTSCSVSADCVGIGDELCLPRVGDGCDDNCIIEECGNGIVQFGEDCDPPEPGVCTMACQFPSSGNGGNGGDGGSSLDFVNFTLGRDLIDTALEPGDTSYQIVDVKNTGKEDLILELEIISLPGFVYTDRRFLPIEIGESEFFNVIFAVPEGEPGAIFIGSALVKYNLTKFESVNIILRIIDNSALFNVSSELESDLIYPFQRIKPMITIDNVEKRAGVNVGLEYFVNDFMGREVKIGEEVFTADMEGNVFQRSFRIPKSVLPGRSAFYVKLNYEDTFAGAVNDFILEKIHWLLYLLVLALVIGMAISGMWYFDDELRRFKWGISAGFEALKTFNINKAIKKYGQMKEDYYYLNQLERKEGAKEGKIYYGELEKAISSGKSSVDVAKKKGPV